MNYYQPRQVDPEADREDAGKWRYTCMNDGQVWPVGYCAGACPGHDTPEGAYEHQTEYVLDNAHFDGEWKDVQHRCEAEGCGAWTTRFASLGPGQMQTHDLCDEHRNRETLAVIVGRVGDSFGSY